MMKMQEDEFEKLKKIEGQCPPHEVVRIYDLGSHIGYGCTKCKFCSHTLEDFKSDKD